MGTLLAPGLSDSALSLRGASYEWYYISHPGALGETDTPPSAMHLPSPSWLGAPPKCLQSPFVYPFLISRTSTCSPRLSELCTVPPHLQFGLPPPDDEEGFHGTRLLTIDEDI